MTEQKIQKKRIDQLESEGYYVIKLIKTNKNGIPDLIAVRGDGSILFSENQDRERKGIKTTRVQT